MARKRSQFARRRPAAAAPAADPRRLRPGQLVTWLNSTPLGPVATDRSVRAHRQAAGLRITAAGSGDKRIDLVRYVAWMARQWRRRNGKPATDSDETGSSSYDAHRERARARQAAASQSGRDIGELPPPENPQRRAAALADLRTFFETYFPQTFYLPWSDAHLQSIADVQRTIENTEMLAEAMPRGWGKSSRFERAALWAGLRGSRRFAVVIGSDESAAVEILDAIKSELETNALLAADFPEVCYPIERLERITQRARGQTYRGTSTWITWEERKIVFPTIPGSAASGFVVRVAGLTGRVRGMKHARPDGTTVRPDLVLLDDPQTDDSARSPAQVEKRLRLINGAVLRMAGPDQRIAAMVSTTVIVPDDLAARLIDRQQSPQWHGRRYQTVLTWPNEKDPAKPPAAGPWRGLCNKYAELRAAGLRRDDGGRAARKFYKAHRAQFDDGLTVGWAAKIEPGDLSAAQSALNWWLDDPQSFWAEGQNDPQPPEAGEASYDAEGLWQHVLKIPRGTAPADAKLLTAFVDVQKSYLVWMVCAWADNFRGHVVDYGTWPEQPEPYFQRRGAKKTIARELPGSPRTEQLYHAMSELTAQLQRRAFPVETQAAGSAAQLSIDLQLIDAGAETDTVVQFIRELRNPRVMPAMGDGLKPSDTPIPERKAKEGQQLGHHWMMHVPAKRAIRYVFVDTNRWKDIVAEGLAAGIGAPNALTIAGDTRTRHRVLLDQLTAEYPEPTEARGRRLNQWRCRPNRENDLFDALVGCAAAASVRGITALGHQPTAPRPRRRRRASGAWAPAPGSGRRGAN